MADPKIKSLKIKTGVVKRMVKETESYEKEVVTETERLEKKKKAGEDEYVIRKQNEVIEDTKQMIPDAKRRLITAVDDLKTCLEDAKDEFSEAGEYVTAKEAVANAETFLEDRK